MKSTLCWECKNACGGCSWSKSFFPINGWDATPVKIKSQSSYGVCIMVDSFIVNKCPFFEKDSLSNTKETKKEKVIRAGMNLRSFYRYTKLGKITNSGQILDKKLKEKYGEYLF